jgi:hypothetical protein
MEEEPIWKHAFSKPFDGGDSFISPFIDKCRIKDVKNEYELVSAKKRDIKDLIDPILDRLSYWHVIAEHDDIANLTAKCKINDHLIKLIRRLQYPLE